MEENKNINNTSSEENKKRDREDSLEDENPNKRINDNNSNPAAESSSVNNNENSSDRPLLGGGDNSHPILGKVYEKLISYEEAVNSKDEDSINKARFELRRERDYLREQISNLEEDDDFTETPEYQHMLDSSESADHAIRDAGAGVVLDSEAGSPDNFVPEPSIYDDTE